MNIRAIITLASGVVLAGVAVYAVNERLSQPTTPPVEAKKPGIELGMVIVAARDLEFGNNLGPEHVEVTSWPVGNIPVGAFSSREELFGADGQEARVVLRPLSKGEPVLPSKVSGFGGRATLSAMLPDGMRAFAIRVNDVSGVGGFLLPGDRVDILLTRLPDGADHNDTEVTDLLLQNIKVRGIDQIADEDRNKPQVVRSVTVEVTPEQAQKLALAMRVGTLSLALRNVATVEEAPARTITVADLAASTKKKQRTGGRPSVRVLRGDAFSTVTVNN